VYIYFAGSTDLGNVSQHVPCICPAYDIGCDSAKYSVAFREAANTDKAHGNVSIQYLVL